MKGVVCYDSVYGCTKQVAEAIADEIRDGGNEVVLINLRESPRPDLDGDVMFLGSPTRWFKMTSEAKDFAKNLKTLGWKDQTIVMFDTMMGVPEDMAERTKGSWATKGAAAKLRDMVKAEGLKVQDEVLHIGVTGLKGPLTTTGTEEAKKYVQQILPTLGK